MEMRRSFFVLFFVVVVLIFLLLVGRIGLFKLSSLLNFLFFNNDCVLISTKKKSLGIAYIKVIPLRRTQSTEACCCRVRSLEKVGLLFCR